MRKSLLCLSVLLLTALAGCVTINVYFPKAAAEKAASHFIGSVIGDEAVPAGASSTSAPASSEDARPASDADHDQPLASRVLDFLVPAAHAADTPDLRINTPEVNAIHARMRQRYKQTMKQLLDDGVIGFTQNGMVAVRDPSAVPLARRAMVNSAVADDNRDRDALYRAIAKANGHPEWEAKIRNIFADLWIRKAHDGWYYQTAGGAWTRK